jgi:hypothetical protein
MSLQFGLIAISPKASIMVTSLAAFIGRLIFGQRIPSSIDLINVSGQENQQ